MGEGKGMETICRCRSFPPISFSKILSCAPTLQELVRFLSIPILQEQFILLLAAKFVPNVIISCCLCAFTYASQQGPMFGEVRLPQFPPSPYNVGPHKNFSLQVFKLPCRAGFFFWASRFHSTFTFAFRTVYAGSALFSSFWIFFYSNNSCNMYHFNYPGGLHSAYNELSCASNFCPLYSDKEAQRQGCVTGEQCVRQGSKRRSS